MMHTEKYCDTLAQLDEGKAINAIHEAYLQLRATAGVASDEGYDNEPALTSLRECLVQAGYVGAADLE